MSLKEVVCKYRGQIEMECNSENTSDANGVHLKGNFQFLFYLKHKFLTDAELLFYISG